jgi:all-trans-8'-apo-beta-carotenal 15,15'-oxygenase
MTVEASTAIDTTQLHHDWRRGYESQTEEFAGALTAIQGRVPPELHGTLFRNGPGLFEVAGRPIPHPFDGDGMVAAFSIKDGEVFYRNRFVRTAGYVAEQRAGRVLYRGVFGMQRPGGWINNLFDLRLKNVANTNVLHWGGKLLALWEAAEPHRLDPATLETIGIDYLDGLLNRGDAFAAHFHIDPASVHDDGRPCLVNFAIKPGLNTRLSLYEFAQSGALLRQQAFELDGFAFLHDMAITPNYYIFFQNPMRYDAIPYALGMQSAAQGLRSVPGRPTQILVIPREPSFGKPRTFRAPSGFVWHHANAFEDGETLVIDSIWYDAYFGIDPDSDFRQIDWTKLPPGRLARTQINLQTAKLEWDILKERSCEFPVLHPARVGRAHRFLYMSAADREEGNAPQQVIWKVDTKTGAEQVWSAAPRGFVSEPIFVPRPHSTDVAAAVTPDVGDPQANTVADEDDGWVLAVVYDAGRHASDLVILDARNLQAGPLATVHLPHHLPHGLHGSFTSRVFM